MSAPALPPIRIGLITPSAGPYAAEGEETRRGASLAAEGRINGRRIELVARSEGGGWQKTGQEIVRLGFAPNLAGVVGGVDSPGAHLMEQVAQKARHVLVVSWASDPTVIGARVPWVFTVAPDDNLRARSVWNRIAHAQRGSIGLLVFADATGAKVERALAARAKRLGLPVPARRWAIAPSGEAGEAAALAASLRAADAAHVDPLICVGPIAFWNRARIAAHGIAPGLRLLAPEDGPPISPAFASRYRSRYHAPPTTPAACAYDAVTALATAARDSAGATRSALLAGHWHGASGPLSFSARGARR